MENIKSINNIGKEYKSKHINRENLNGLQSKSVQGSVLKKVDEKEQFKQQFLPKIMGQ